MIYHDCEESELLKILSQDDIDFASNVRIPYGAGAGLWARKHFIDEKISEAIESGEISRVVTQPVKGSYAPYQISDYIEGGELKSMVDGKMYDSKSQYYKSLKERGMVIVGNEKMENKKIDSDLTGRDIKDAIERIKSR